MHKVIRFLTAALLLIAAAPLAAAPRAEAGTLTFHREELPGGAVLLVKEAHQLPLVNIRVSIPAGARNEPVEKAGLANLTAALLARGTEQRSALDIEKLNDWLGGGVDANAGRRNATASIKLLTRDLDQGFELLADVLRRPTFPEKEFEKKRRRLIGSLRQSEDDPVFLANVALRKGLFGQRAAGRLPEGSRESLKKIQRADLVAFHKKWYGMKGAIFVLVGDITPQRARELVEANFKDWKAAGGTLPEPPPAPSIEGMKLIQIDRQLSQTTVLLGNRSLKRTDPRFYAARVMNYILGGGGFDSRILNNIREEKGLVYAAYSYFASGRATGHWRLMLQTKNKSANEAIHESLAEIRRIQKSGVTDKEIQGAKDFITGNFATQFASSDRIADYMMAVERLGFPPDYADTYLARIRGVTKAQVLAAARDFIRLDESVLVVVGNLRQAQVKLSPPQAEPAAAKPAMQEEKREEAKPGAAPAEPGGEKSESKNQQEKKPAEPAARPDGSGTTTP